MIVEVYESPEGIITVIGSTHSQKSIIVEDNSTLLRTIESETWEGCMIKHHELMGWEPYKTF
jgi:hypothetical protein